MVYNTQNYWVFGLLPSSGILENTTFRKLDLFPFSGEGRGGGKRHLLNWAPQKALISIAEWVSSPPASPQDGNSFRNVVFSRIPDDGKSQKAQ
jgi:hypothetical protein